MPRSIAELRKDNGGLDGLTDEQIVKTSYPDYQKYYGTEDEYAKAIGYKKPWSLLPENSMATSTAYQSSSDGVPILQSAFFESTGLVIFFAILCWAVYKMYLEELMTKKTPRQTGALWATCTALAALSTIPHQFRSKDTANAVVASLVVLVMYAATGFFLGWVYRKLRPDKAVFGVESKPVETLSLLQRKPDMQSVGAELVADKPSKKIDLNLHDSGQSPAETAANAAPDTDENHWAAALAELDGGNRRQGVWAKAFADSDGDEVQAKVAYLKARVRQLTAPAVDS